MKITTINQIHQNTRDMPTTPEVTQPTIEVGGIEIPLPDPGPLDLDHCCGDHCSHL